MIKSTEYPMNIGGRGYQKEYKGFDIAVIIKKGEGVRIFILKKDGGIFHQDKKKYAEVNECFSSAEKIIDNAVQASSIIEQSKVKDESERMKDKCYSACMSAFANALTFSKGDNSRIRYFFEYELQKQFDKI